MYSISSNLKGKSNSESTEASATKGIVVRRLWHKRTAESQIHAVNFFSPLKLGEAEFVNIKVEELENCQIDTYNGCHSLCCPYEEYVWLVTQLNWHPLRS